MNTPNVPAGRLERRVRLVELCQNMKTIEIFDFIKEPKTRKQIQDKFGKHCSSSLECLIKSRAARKFEGFADDTSSIYSHNVVLYFVATGVEHLTNFTKQSPRRAYNQEWYKKRKALNAKA